MKKRIGKAHAAREGCGSIVHKQASIATVNRARGIPDQRAAAKEQSEIERCSKHYGYRSGPDSAGNRRPIPIRTMKSLAMR